MVYTPTLFAVAIPEDLAVDLRAMADGNGITPEALVLSILRGRVKDWRGRHRDALPPVPRYTPVVQPTPIERDIAYRAEQAVTKMAALPPRPHVPDRTPYPATEQERLERLVRCQQRGERETLRDAIVAVLSGVPMSPQFIAARVSERRGATRYQSVCTLLSMLVAGGVVTRFSRGLYTLAVPAEGE